MGHIFDNPVRTTNARRFAAPFGGKIFKDVTVLKNGNSLKFVKTVQKDQKRSSGPNTDFVGQQKRGARRLDMKNGGVKKFSSFIWTLMVKTENEKGRTYIRQSGEDIFSTIR